MYECILPRMSDDGQSDYEYKGNLGIWLHNQRQFNKKCKILPERAVLLQHLADEGT